jgi:hypothetical protein
MVSADCRSEKSADKMEGANLNSRDILKGRIYKKDLEFGLRVWIRIRNLDK